MNIISVLLFSFITAQSVNQGIRYVYRGGRGDIKASPISSKRSGLQAKSGTVPSLAEYENAILESGFFKVTNGGAGEDSPAPGTERPDVPIEDLYLVGTITGHRSIARAMVRHRKERHPEVFRLWSDVYGYRLVKIARNRIYLRAGKTTEKIGIFDKRNRASRPSRANTAVSGSAGRIRKMISRAEIKQRVLNNLDNAMRGLVAGPHREGGRITGYRLKKVRPYNILYKLGARSGDVVKRINGRKVDSVNRLYSMWQSLQNESQIIVDMERHGRPLQFEFNIHE